MIPPLTACQLNAYIYSSFSWGYDSAEDETPKANPVSQLSFYDVLAIPPDSSAEQIKHAYRDLARRYHPDLPDNRHNTAACEMFLKVQEAYDLLSDERQRKRYDAIRKILETPPPQDDEVFIPSACGFINMGPIPAQWQSGSIHVTGSINLSSSMAFFSPFGVVSGSAVYPRP